MTTTLADDKKIEGLDNVLKQIVVLRNGMNRQYDRAVNRDLSKQNNQNLFGRNIIAVLQQTYEDTLKCARSNLGTLNSQHTSDIIDSFNGMIEELMQYALQKHRTTCAISNFPDEHNPSHDYIARVLDDVGSEWHAFQEKLNAILENS